MRNMSETKAETSEERYEREERERKAAWGNPGHPAHVSIDGARVQTGMWFWDYDLRPSQVTDGRPLLQGSEDGPLGIQIWWSMTAGSMDSKRLWRRYPGGRSRASAPKAGETPEAWAARVRVPLGKVNFCPAVALDKVPCTETDACLCAVCKLMKENPGH